MLRADDDDDDDDEDRDHLHACDDDDNDEDDEVQADATDMEELRQLMARIAKQWLTFPRLRQEMLNQGAPDPLIFSPTNMDVREAVLALLDPVRPSEQRERAYVALTRSLAGHPELASTILAESPKPAAIVDLAPQRQEQAIPAPEALQAMLNARNDVFARWNDFQEGMHRVGLTVCQVIVDEKVNGTGFLVGDRYVLTACHCVLPLIDNGRQTPGSENKLSFVFDDVVMPGISRSVFRTEIKAARQWLIKFSLPDDLESSALTPLDEICNDCLDFALICLAQPAGAMAPKQHRSAQRKWLELDDLAKEPEGQSQMLIAHHPAGADLRLTVGLFRDFAKQSRRVRYLTPAISGSSGAPCFSVEWKPFALHNAGYPGVPVNQGVPLKLIWDAIGGRTAFANPDPEPFMIPPVMPDGKPILGRIDIIREVDAMLRGASPSTVLTIAGPPGSGKKFTATLARAMLIDRGHTVFMLDAEKFAADTPEAFSRRLIHEIRGSDVDLPQPATPDCRQRARWISRNLSDWTRASVAGQDTKGADAEPGAKRMIWIILTHCEAVRFSTETHDLLVALLGDEAQGDDVALRFMLTGYDGDLAALSAEQVWQTTLDLVSVNGVLPFMQHALASLSVHEDPDTLQQSASDYVELARSVGVSSISQLVAALMVWRRTREKRKADAESLPAAVGAFA